MPAWLCAPPTPPAACAWSPVRSLLQVQATAENHERTTARNRGSCRCPSRTSSPARALRAAQFRPPLAPSQLGHSAKATVVAAQFWLPPRASRRTRLGDRCSGRTAGSRPRSPPRWAGWVSSARHTWRRASVVSQRALSAAVVEQTLPGAEDRFGHAWAHLRRHGLLETSDAHTCKGQRGALALGPLSACCVCKWLDTPPAGACKPTSNGAASLDEAGCWTSQGAHHFV